MSTENEESSEIERARQIRESLRKKGYETSPPSNSSSEEALGHPCAPALKTPLPSKQETEKDIDLDSETNTETALASVELRGKQQELELRGKVLTWIIWAVSLQLIVSAVSFGFYLGVNLEDPDARIMMAWLGSSVVEVVGLAAIVTRSLFPNQSKKETT